LTFRNAFGIFIPTSRGSSLKVAEEAFTHHSQEAGREKLMDTFGNAVLGLIFLGLSFTSTFLMFKLWGYPFDHNTHKSSAPRPLMLLHRAIGYVYLAIYIYLMSQMLPRLWTYQVELPARTVAHLMLGMSIGVIVVAKIAIVRFFKHLESQMVPILGTALLLSSVLLIGLSAPIAFREHYLSTRSAAGATFSVENLQRVRTLLPQAGFASSVPLDEISNKLALQIGRRVLVKRCVQCHDLRTILVRPKTRTSGARLWHAWPSARCWRSRLENKNNGMSLPISWRSLPSCRDPL
jgi:hypothetical protein